MFIIQHDKEKIKEFKDYDAVNYKDFSYAHFNKKENKIIYASGCNVLMSKKLSTFDLDNFIICANENNNNKYPIKINNFGYLFLNEKTVINQEYVIKRLNKLIEDNKEYGPNVLWNKFIYTLNSEKVIDSKCEIALMLSDGEILSTIKKSPLTINKIETQIKKFPVDLIKKYKEGRYIALGELKGFSVNELESMIREYPRLFAKLTLSKYTPLNHYIDIFDKPVETKSSILELKDDGEKECVHCQTWYETKHLSTKSIDGKFIHLCLDCSIEHQAKINRNMHWEQKAFIGE